TQVSVVKLRRRNNDAYPMMWSGEDPNPNKHTVRNNWNLSEFRQKKDNKAHE
ncbi:hypothetical protein S245_060854, partial [Arachis hypogaea]